VSDGETRWGEHAPRLRILLVEDEAFLSVAVEDELKGAGFDVEVFGALAPALEWLAEHTPDAGVLDVSLGHETSLEIARVLQHRNVPFLVATAHKESERLLPGIDNVFWLSKPFGPDAVVDTLMGLLIGQQPGI
jgi:DNA-binding response OmpR family regulator